MTRTEIGNLLAEYHNLDLEYMIPEDALAALAEIASEMAEYIEDSLK